MNAVRTSPEEPQARADGYPAPVPHPDADRFLTVPQVAEELATNEVQVIAMLRRVEIRAT